jgi:hypothetical protein
MKLRSWAKDPLVWVTLALGLLYLAISAARPEGTFWSLDEGGKFLYLQNVSKTGSVTAPLIYPGAALDPELRFVPLFYYAQVGSQMYSWWPIGFPLLTLPLYHCLGWIGLYILPALAGALSALFAGLLVRQNVAEPRWLAVLAALITGVATPIAFYSSMYWEHTLATACVVAAVSVTVRAWSKQKMECIIAAGVLASAATFLRTEIVAIAAGIGLTLLLRRWRWGISFGASFVAASIPWLLFNYQTMGNFLSRQWEPGTVSLSGSIFGGIQQVGKWFLAYLFLNAPRIGAYELTPTILTLGTTLILLGLALPLLKPLRPVALAAYFGIVMISGAVVLSHVGYRSVHGFVLVAPQVVFATWLYVRWERNSAGIFPPIVLGIIAVFGTVFVARAWAAAGGQQWGPRYLLPLYPLLTAAIVIGVHQSWPRLGRSYRTGLMAALVLSTLVGVGFEVRGVHASLRTTTYYADSLVSLRGLSTTPILTECTWLPMVMPEFYWQGNVYNVRGNEQLAAWQEKAEALGMRSAYSVTLDICNTRGFHEVARGRVVDPDGLTVSPVLVKEQ